MWRPRPSTRLVARDAWSEPTPRPPAAWRAGSTARRRSCDTPGRIPPRWASRLLLRPLHLLAALDLVGLVDGGGVLLACTALDGLLLAVPGVDRVVAVAAGELVVA